MSEFVEKKIYFYRLLDFKTNKPANVNLISSELDKLKFYNDVKQALNTTNSRFCPLSGSEGLAMGVFTHDVSKKQFTLAKLRREQLPEVIKGNSKKNLSIDKESWLGDSIHIRLFPNGIVGVDTNGYSVYPVQLERFINYRLKDKVPQVRMALLSKKSYKETIKDLKQLRKVRLKVSSEITTKLKDKKYNSIRAAIDANKSLVESKFVEVTFGSESSINSFIKKTDLDNITSLLDDINLAPFISNFEIMGRFGDSTKSEDRNLKSNDFHFSTEVIRVDKRNRRLDSKSVFSSIENLHKDNKEFLEKAVAIEKAN